MYCNKDDTSRSDDSTEYNRGKSKRNEFNKGGLTDSNQANINKGFFNKPQFNKQEGSNNTGDAENSKISPRPTISRKRTDTSESNRQLDQTGPETTSLLLIPKDTMEIGSTYKVGFHKCIKIL